MGDQLMPWHKSWMVDITYDRVDLVKEGANSQAYIKLLKSKGGNTMDLEQILAGMKPEHAEVVKAALATKDTAVAEAVEKAKQAEEAAAKAAEEVEKAKSNQAPVPGTSEEEILKSVKDPAVKALLETQIAKTKAAEEEVRKSRDAEATREAVAKAKEVSGIGAEEEQLAGIYKKLKAVDPALCEDVFGIFKAASAVKEDQPFTPVGKSTAGVSYTSQNEDEAWGKIEEVAKTIASEEKISQAAAVTKAIAEHPDLYQAYLDAQSR